jgi:NADPH:quinone reductase-like Zn-dependent oxidoreductase
MPNAIRIHQTGGPDVLRWEAVDLPAPAPGEATVRHHAVGLNYIDVYTAPAFIRSPCRPVSAWRARAWSKRWARA